MILYSIKKCQDVYTITNTGASTISYVTEKLYDCTNFLHILDGEILVGESFIVDFTGDGEYQIVLSQIGEDDFTIPINYYLALQLSLIESIGDVLCDCDCGCSDCSDTSKGKYCNLLMARAKTDVYKRLINPDAVAFFDGVYKYTKCLITKPIYCSVAEEVILGTATCNEKLTKQLLGLDYLALYFFEFWQVCTNEDKEYVRTKFQTQKIFCCIQALGINIGQIEQLIKDSMGQISINSASYINQPPSQVGDNELNVANRAVTLLSLAMFTALTTPIYVDPEGDPVADVRIDTLPTDGVLKLNAIDVIIGQIIPVADINANLFTYESPNQDALDNDVFNFSLRDTGSGLFSS